MANFYCVIGNRDKLKIKDENGEVIRQDPIWKYIEDQNYWLTSLVYAKNIEFPPGYKFLDCGAWSSKKADHPKWTPRECIEHYKKYANPGDKITSPDHMVLKGHDWIEEDRRIKITLDNAQEFIKLCPTGLTPVAVTHGNDLSKRIGMTKEMLDMGYRYIAVGGVAGITGSKKKVRSILKETVKLREKQDFYIHVLGVSALSWYPVYKELGIDSFDGSSMFFAAFTGAQYYWPDPDGIIKYSVKELKPDQIPLCNCPACKAMRAQGDDTRTMGNNEKNMGRAVHNINVYLKVMRKKNN